jgi:hypothetical protein
MLLALFYFPTMRKGKSNSELLSCLPTIGKNDNSEKQLGGMYIN